MPRACLSSLDPFLLAVKFPFNAFPNADVLGLLLGPDTKRAMAPTALGSPGGPEAGQGLASIVLALLI